MYHLLPTRLRQRIAFRMLKIPSENLEGLIFKIADTEEELEASFRLVYDAYFELGYCEPNETKLRATIYHALPTTTTLIAVFQNQIVGTLTIVRDNRFNLPLEKVFDVSVLRKHSSRIAEITSLVIRKDFRREKGGQVLFPLLKLMYEYSTSYFGVDHLAITIHPKNIDFYQFLLCFEQIPHTEVKTYFGTPAIALHLDLKCAPQEFKKHYADQPEHKNLYNFFVLKKNENHFLWPKRDYHKINDPIVSFSYFKKLFVHKLKIVKQFQETERRQIESYFDVTSHQNKMGSKRKNPRIEVETPCQIFSEYVMLQNNAIVKDVSRRGLRIYFEKNILLKSEFKISVQISKNKFSVLTAKPVWMSADLGMALEITSADQAWDEFIDLIYNEHFGSASEAA